MTQRLSAVISLHQGKTDFFIEVILISSLDLFYCIIVFIMSRRYLPRVTCFCFFFFDTGQGKYFVPVTVMIIDTVILSGVITAMPNASCQLVDFTQLNYCVLKFR